MSRWRHVLRVAAVLGIVAVLATVVVLVRPDPTAGPASDAPRADRTPGPPPTPATGLPDLPAESSAPPPVSSPSATTPLVPGASELLDRIEQGTSFEPCAPTRELGPIRAASFNLHGGVARNGRYDLAGIVRELRAWDVDVVFLQEVHRFRRRSGLADMPADLAAALEMEFAFGPNFTLPAEAPGAPRRESGTAILSRFPISDVANTLLPNRPGLQQRGLLRARITLRGQPVDVYSTHLDHQSAAARLAQATAISAALGSSTVPALVGGDLNARPGSAPYQAVALALRDTWRAVGEGSGLTAPNGRPRVRIDYVFARGRWEALASYVVASAVSDHRAVLSDLTLTVPNDCG